MRTPKNLLFFLCITLANAKFHNFTNDFKLTIQKSAQRISHHKVFSTEQHLLLKDFDELNSEKWMELPLDHFNPFDDRTWKMRYFVFDHFYEEGGPLFIEVAGEWSAGGTSFIGHLLSKLAVKYKGMMVETEHRYYGESLPFSTNFSSANLKYLTYEQALEDLAYFIQRFKADTPDMKNSKVILHGCSYPGMLVTWMRLKYPHIVDIAFASSAPLGVGLEYTGFYEILGDIYTNASDDCIETIKQGFSQTHTLLESDEGTERVKYALRDYKCDNVNVMSAKDIIDTYIYILDTVYDTYHYEDVACLAMTMNRADLQPYERLAKFAGLKAKDRGRCFHPIDDAEEEKDFTNMTDERARIDRAWDYQLCTQMGFNTLHKNSSRNVFGIEIDVHSFLRKCVNDFGEEFTEDIVKKGTSSVTRRYGGLTPKVTKVVTVQGTHDPWKELAHLNNLTDQAPVFIFDGSHCANMYIDPNEGEELPNLRQTVDTIISKWLDEIL